MRYMSNGEKGYYMKELIINSVQVNATHVKTFCH